MGGIESLLMTLFRASSSPDVRILVVQHGQRKAYYAAELKRLGIDLVCCPIFSPKTVWTYGHWWRSYLKQFQDQTILHCHVRSTASIILREARRKGIHTIAHSHGMSHGQGLKRLVRQFLAPGISRYADVCLACSKEAGIWLFGEELVEKACFHVIHNPINLESFTFSPDTRETYRALLQLEKETLCLMHVGRFSFEKNHAFLIEMMDRARQRGLDHWVLYLIGAGSLLEEIKKMCRLRHLENVVFLGLRDDVPELLQACDVFLFPSTFEGLGTALVEAQATGAPCLISPAISPGAVITDLVYRLEMDPDAWVETILQAPRGDTRTERSEDVIRAGYDLESVLDAYRSIYEGLFAS
ncbi:MAG: glycosyltransferase [Bacillota bacterium]|nr:glycosyltransferase [Bacillota bacterium]